MSHCAFIQNFAIYFENVIVLLWCINHSRNYELDVVASKCLLCGVRSLIYQLHGEDVSPIESERRVKYKQGSSNLSEQFGRSFGTNFDLYSIIFGVNSQR